MYQLNSLLRFMAIMAQLQQMHQLSFSMNQGSPPRGCLQSGRDRGNESPGPGAASPHPRGIVQGLRGTAEPWTSNPPKRDIRADTRTTGLSENMSLS